MTQRAVIVVNKFVHREIERQEETSAFKPLVLASFQPVEMPNENAYAFSNE
jgi:hypothetical protein